MGRIEEQWQAIIKDSEERNVIKMEPGKCFLSQPETEQNKKRLNYSFNP